MPHSMPPYLLKTTSFSPVNGKKGIGDPYSR